MKLSYIFSIAFAAIPLLLSCDAQDEAEELIEVVTNPGDEDYSYYSLSTGDSWIYDVTVDNLDTQEDFLAILSTTTNGGATFAQFEGADTNIGFMSTLLGNGALSESNDILRYTGALVVTLDGENEISLDIPLLALYDENATIGDQVDELRQTVTQEIDGVPVTVDATITTEYLGIAENFAVNGFVFNRALSARFTVNVTITATVLGVPVTLLTPQDVIIATNAYAENVGLVDSTLNFDYEFVDLSGFGIVLPFPETSSNIIVQQVTSYEVAADD